jgi:hypothetical protein
MATKVIFIIRFDIFGECTIKEFMTSILLLSASKIIVLYKTAVNGM